MNQKTNITILLMVLSIPFALSQTRKAIPAGRYEVLSGVKSIHAAKTADGISLGKDAIGLFWSEVSKNIPTGRTDNTFFSSQNSIDANIRSALLSKGALESKSFDERVNIFLSDDLQRDIGMIKKLKMQGSLVVLKDKSTLKEVMSNCANYDVILYQAEADQNYFLLKAK